MSIVDQRRSMDSLRRIRVRAKPTPTNSAARSWYRCFPNSSISRRAIDTPTRTLRKRRLLEHRPRVAADRQACSLEAASRRQSVLRTSASCSVPRWAASSRSATRRATRTTAIPATSGRLHRTGPNGDGLTIICVAQGIPEALVDTFQHTTTALPASTGGNLGPGAGNGRYDHLRVRLAARVREQRPRRDGRLLGHFHRRRHQDDRWPVGSSAVLQPRIQPDARPGQPVLPLIARGRRNRHGERSLHQLPEPGVAGDKRNRRASQPLQSISAQGSCSRTLPIGWLNNYEEQSLPGDPFLDYAGTIGGPANRVVDNDVHPEWKLSLMPDLCLRRASSPCAGAT